METQSYDRPDAAPVRKRGRRKLVIAVVLLVIYGAALGAGYSLLLPDEGSPMFVDPGRGTALAGVDDSGRTTAGAMAGANPPRRTWLRSRAA